MAVDYFPSLVLRPTPSFSMLHAIKGLFYVTLYPGYPCNVENIGWPGYEAISICAVLIWKLRGSMWASAGMRLITLHAVYILHTSSAFLEPHEHWSGMNLQSLSKCSSSWLCSSNLLQPNCWFGAWDLSELARGYVFLCHFNNIQWRSQDFANGGAQK